jgi:hypothetical protein
VARADRVKSRLAVRRVRVFRAIRNRRLRLASVARAGAIRGHSPLRRLYPRHHRLRMGHRRGHWRRDLRLRRPQADDDPGYSRLFLDDRLERARLGLGVLRRPTLPRRGRYRLGMGNGGVHRLRVVARPRARQGRRALAMRRRARRHPCLGCVARDRLDWPKRLAVDVPGRRASGTADHLDPARHTGVAAVGAVE